MVGGAKTANRRYAGAIDNRDVVNVAGAPEQGEAHGVASIGLSFAATHYQRWFLCMYG
jgi:hypothetical protein